MQICADRRALRAARLTALPSTFFGPYAMDHAEDSYDVLIVGFGPAGAVASGLLGRLGHRVLVVERLPTIYDKPRAIALDHEIFRHFDNMGLAEAVAPHVAPFTASQHFGAEGQLIRRIDMVPAPYPLGYTPSMVFTQPPVEAELRRHAEALATVEVATGVELIDLAQTDAAVTAKLRAANGDTRHVQARYLIGCDGASSTVRQLVGIALEDLIFDEPWLVVDVLVKDAALAKLPETSAQFCDPARPATFVIGPGNHRRWEIMLLPGENGRDMAQPAAVWSLLARWLQPDDGELWRAAAYRFHALVADDWRRGRVVIAGDAAHQQPPFFGQGMCQGLRDVTNLVWKLDRVLTGASDNRLLDSYTRERKRHVIELTSLIKTIGETICVRDPDVARARDAKALAEGNGQPRTMTRQEIIPPIREGIIAGTEAPARGTLFPQPGIMTDTGCVLLDTLTGTGWRLILDGRQLALGAVADSAARVADIFSPAIVAIAPAGAETVTPDCLRERDGVMAGWFARYGIVAALVRPDHYVYGAVRSASDLTDLLNEAAAHLAADALRPAATARQSA